MLVRRMTYEALGIVSFELVDPQGSDLPSFAAGAHIDVRVPGGFVRQYSLHNHPQERHRYCIAVLKERPGTGGSRSMHENVRVGDLLTISYPRCHFRVADGAHRHLLLAGGIGVTPIISMLEYLAETSREFVLHYCTRTKGATAFLERMAVLAEHGEIFNHYDNGDPATGLDISALLAGYRDGTHLYCCGPAGFMRAVEQACQHWPRGSVHFEHFSPPVMPADHVTAPRDPASEFQIQIGENGPILAVPPERSIVQVLREHFIEVETSCEAGICGTCKTRYLAGEPQHNDFVLTDAEKREWVMICCARSKSALLVLDIETAEGAPAERMSDIHGDAQERVV